jgi:hypothetical protein
MCVWLPEVFSAYVRAVAEAAATASLIRRDELNLLADYLLIVCLVAVGALADASIVKQY